MEAMYGLEASTDTERRGSSLRFPFSISGIVERYLIMNLFICESFRFMLPIIDDNKTEGKNYFSIF